jgi:Phosphodiester glycosidase
MPGVSYERQVVFTLHGPVVVNVIEGPRPGGLYSLEPVLAKGSVQGRERLTAIEKRMTATATVAGVNGDLFSSSGRPNGLFLQGGVMQTPPFGSRSSLGIDASGRLEMARIGFFADWQGTGPRRPLTTLNDDVGAGGTGLFTPAWVGTTPPTHDSVEAVLAPFPKTSPNGELTGKVVQLVPNGGHTIPPNGVVLQARGTSAPKLANEAQPGTTITVRLILPNPLAGAVNGIGGGPALVRNGRPIFRPREAFATSWLVPRTPRTAVGQLADGRVLLVAVDGSHPGYSTGMTNFELAQTMVRLGAVTAFGLDSGLSTTMAFEGDLLNRPSDPSGERPIADALLLEYFGVQAGPPAADVVSPPRERQTLSYKLVRPSIVTASLVGPGGVTVTLDSGPRTPGTRRFSWSGLTSAGRLEPEGRWSWQVNAVDDLGRKSEADRPFFLNTTLKDVQVAPDPFRVRRGRLRIGIELVHPARLSVRIETPGGVLLRALPKRSAGAGGVTVTWNGRLRGRRPAPAGRYVARVVAKNQFGEMELAQPFRARR